MFSTPRSVLPFRSVLCCVSVFHQPGELVLRPLWGIPAAHCKNPAAESRTAPGRLIILTRKQITAGIAMEYGILFRWKRGLLDKRIIKTDDQVLVGLPALSSREPVRLLLGGDFLLPSVFA